MPLCTTEDWEDVGMRPEELTSVSLKNCNLDCGFYFNLRYCVI